MRQNSRGFNSYFLFIMLLLMGVAVLTTLNGADDKYTREQFVNDLEAGRVQEVTVNPNAEAPTGYLRVELKNGADMKLYVTDIVEAENLVRSYGFDPQVKDVPREGWVLTTLVPMLIVLAVGIFLFMMVNAQNAGGNNSKMMNFGKSRARLSMGDKNITFAQVAGLKEEKEELLEQSTKWAQDREYLDCVQDILDNKVFQSMDQFIQHGHTTCKAHCIQVSYIAFEICRRRGWDSRSAARAGLLHDLFLYDWHTHAKETGEYFHGFTHPRVAMENAVRYFQIPEKEQQDYTDKWEDLEVQTSRSGFNEVFTHTSMIFAKAKAKQNLLDEFR